MSHYLDYNATAPVRPEVRAAMVAALALPGNPSSVHGPGREARACVEEGRANVARLAGTAPGNIVFTGSGSEANNLALVGTKPGRILVSAIEHPSVLRPAAEQTGGFALIPVTSDGVADLAVLEDLLAAAGDGPVLVSVMMANNETGVVQPTAEVVALARAAGALVHVDAVQAAGRVALDFDALGADLMSLSAHKIGGPKGIGALVVRPGLELSPLVRGGGQERGLRAGTENVPGIAGFGAAASCALGELAAGAEIARQRALRDRLEGGVAALAPDAVVIGADAPRLANTACLALPGRLAETLVIAFDLAGVAVSAGSACSSGKVEASHVLSAMNPGPEVAAGAIRVSVGFGTTDADVDAFIAALAALLQRASDNQPHPAATG
ncbi:MAG: cysteine desulfurase [Alphaproteobacteria bacterium]|nr:cysteine desulfurase [Alphaproteobacteria bacterium]